MASTSPSFPNQPTFESEFDTNNNSGSQNVADLDQSGTLNTVQEMSNSFALNGAFEGSSIFYRESRKIVYGDIPKIYT